jgi:dihydroxyacetone kinase
VVAEVNLLPKDLGTQTKLQRVGENLCASVGPFFRSFDHKSLVSRPFSARKVSNRSSHHVLQNGLGEVSLIQLSVWSTVRSNLGQTWSTFVKLG